MEEIEIYAKKIELFLVNGTADSIITAELSNWNGTAVKVPRTEIQNYDRKDLSKVGIYFLFCQEDDGSASVYIGESEDMLDRLRQHLKDYQSGKETFYWHTVVAFTSSDMNKALIRYLEDKLVKDARDCGRYKVLTRITYSTPLKESQIATMAEFIDNVKLIISTMSYNVFSPIPKETDKKIYLYCKSKSSGASAKGFVSSGGLTVLKGAKISDHVVPSFMNSRGGNSYKLRLKLEEEGVISDRVFRRSYEFTAPSAASAVVLGHNSNGNVDWKTEDGTALGEL